MKARPDLLDAILSEEAVMGYTHDFYRYPARFSPKFVGAAIREFTEVGDVVFDPFMGGGTTLVEARAQGRHAVGIDISSLATFISRVKTNLLSGSDSFFGLALG
jgi:DNA modification methylase